MRNTFKRIIAMLIAGTMLLSVAACSKVSDGEQSAEGKEIVNAADGENVVSNKNDEAIRAEIKQKAADIIATLEVGKTYDEMPITAQKLGVERFSATSWIPLQSGTVREDKIFVDLREQVVCKLPDSYSRWVPEWHIGTGENGKITHEFYGFGETGALVNHSEESAISSLRQLYNHYGYDSITYYNAHYTYIGREEVEGFGETLVFEADNGEEKDIYYVDPETGFWVMQGSIYEGATNIVFNIKDIVIEPEFEIPDFESKAIDYSTFDGFETFDEAKDKFIEAVKNKDYDSIALMVPQSEEIYRLFREKEMIGYKEETQKMTSVLLTEEVIMACNAAEEVLGKDSSEFSFYERSNTYGIDSLFTLSGFETVIQAYEVVGTYGDAAICVCFVKDTNDRWFVFAWSDYFDPDKF